MTEDLNRDFGIGKFQPPLGGRCHSEWVSSEIEFVVGIIDSGKSENLRDRKDGRIIGSIVFIGLQLFLTRLNI